jgi:G3E family GTPase
LIELRSREVPPELLVVECSGVADPTSVAHHAMIPGYRLEAVVVVVDAETIRGRARDQIVGRTILRQFDAADVVLLNKVDLVDPGQLADLTDWVRDRCDGAVVIPSVRSEVPVEAILGGGFPQLVRSVGDVPTVEHDHVDGVDHDAASWSTTDLVDRSALDHFVASLPDGVIRAKGILRLAEAPSLRHALQVVGRRSELSPVGPWGVGGAESVMVVIGLPGSLVSLDWPVTAGPAPS